MVSADPSPFESVEAMDLEFARLARASGALRFGLGAGLEALACVGGHHELGFASLEAYALERCERSSRWVQESRWLARRLAGLPEVRGALLLGKISFSMAQWVAKVARADDQAQWLAEVQGLTVRELRLLVKQRAESLSPAVESELAFNRGERDCKGADGEGPETTRGASDDEESVVLTVTVDREDAWLFECTRMVVEQIAGKSAGQTIEASLGEGTTSLFAMLSRDAVVNFGEEPGDATQREWEAQLGRWREEAEARCERALRVRAASRPASQCEVEFASGFDFEGDAAAIDAKLRRIAANLAKRDVALGELAEAFWRADGWRRLGYATAVQYTRERLGMSESAIKAKRTLARRAGRLPELAAAVAHGEVGYEAARLVASVATTDTVREWIERATERTVRYLREEVDAVQLFARLAPGSMTSPPDEEIMRELASIESAVVSGAMFHTRAQAAMDFQKAEASQMSAEPSESRKAFERARRRSWAARHSGRATLHFRVTAETRAYYRRLERLFERHGPPRLSFLRFLCCALIEAWKHTLGQRRSTRVSTVEIATVVEVRCAGGEG